MGCSDSIASTDADKMIEGKDGRLFAVDIFRCIFVNKKFFLILIKISPKFVPKGLIDNNPRTGLKMAWRRIGARPLFKPILTQFTEACMRRQGVDVISFQWNVGKRNKKE